MKFHFTHLVLENWRNFRKVDVPLSERVFVVGPNAAGKTNLLDALRFLHDIARPEGSLARAVSTRGGFAHLRSLHARQESRIRLQVGLAVGEERWTYELVLSGAQKRPVHVERERVEKNGKDIRLRPDEHDPQDQRLKEQTHLEQLSQNEPFRQLVDALSNVVHVHLVPQVAKSIIRSDEVALRDAPGSDFIDQLARLPDKKQRGTLSRIERLLRVAVPQFSELRVVRDDVGRPHLEARYRHWRPQGSWQNEAEFSDGTLRLIGLLWSILHGDAPLLLEEPELSLHRDVVRQLPRLMARAAHQKGRQIIVSTHSEEMLKDTGVDPASVVLLIPSGEETRVSLASGDPALVEAAKAGLPLGDLVVGKTRPKGIEQLSFQLEPRSR